MDNGSLIWVIVCAFLVFLMQAGFLCVETGLTRSKNNVNVALKNLTNSGICFICFWLVGFAQLYGSFGTGGLNFYDLLAFSPHSKDSSVIVLFLFQMMFCSTAVTILSGAAAERLKYQAWGAIAAFIAIAVYPLVARLVWHGSVSGNSPGILASLGFVDFAGTTVVHSTGGWASLAAIYILGPRIGRFTADGKSNTAPSSLPMAILGVFILWFGWYGFNGGSAGRFDGSVPAIILNTTIGGAAGLIVSQLISYFLNKRVDIVSSMNGALAGLVSVTGGCHVFSVTDSFIAASVGAALMIYSDRLMERWKLDDAVSAIPVHLVAGIWGTLAVGILGSPDLLKTGHTVLQQTGVQLFGAVVVGAFSFGATFVFIKVLMKFIDIRVTAQSESVGLNESEHAARSESSNLMQVMREHQNTGNFSAKAEVNLFSSIGAIAEGYNSVVSQVHENLLQRKEHERKVTSAKRRYEAVIKSALDCIIIIDADGNIVDFNPAAEKTLGHKKENLVGKEMAALIIPEKFRDAHRNGISHFLMTGQGPALNKRLELSALHADGRELPIELTIVANQNEDGSMFFTGFMRDLTEVKELAAINEQQSRELLESNAKLVHASRLTSLGEMASGIAHEINNPLSIIIGHAEFRKTEMARGRVDPSEIARSLDAILKTGQRISGIVSGLLRFAREGTGDDFHSDLARDVVDEALVLCDNKFKVNNINLSVAYRQSEDLKIECRKIQLSQVILNMLNNAFDVLYDSAQQDKWVRIAIENNETEVCFTVENNGPEIPAEALTKIFEPFYTTKAPGKGTGLGLSVSHGIIAAHRGSLECKSDKKSTMFIIKMPLSQPALVRAV